MKQDTFYFPHDYTASNDPKMINCLAECGLPGVALYWMIIELLHQEPSGKIEYRTFKHLINFNLSKDPNVTIDNVDNYVERLIDTGLFIREDDYITSKRVEKNKNIRKEISKKRSMAGKLGGKRRWNPVKQNEAKETKDKKKRFVPPTVEEVREYCQQRNNDINPEQFVNHYEANGWKRGKTPIKSWQACVRTWEQNDKQNSNGTQNRYKEL